MDDPPPAGDRLRMAKATLHEIGPRHLVCPLCGNQHGSDVKDSRVTHAGAKVWRRRECVACQQRFTTYETAIDPAVFEGPKARAKLLAAQLRAMAAALEGWW